MKNVTPHATPEEYIASQPEATRSALAGLHAAISAAQPGLTPHMCAGMIGYGPLRYRTSSGCEGDWFVAGLAVRKAGFTLHVNGCGPDGISLVERDAARLGKVSVGRACVRFKRPEDLNLPVALDLIRQAAEILRGGGGSPGVTVMMDQ